ncbi:uncharacterized protein LOC111034615 [Myzus persicae]|uniref:uncharacterized protein LOC111034615 n=1 Tax=Myzus persicae TaxID=13164 RepID=UPI000B930A22|nr:uncharacterized protein LOC111034615 [Myzus persicae]
MVRITSFSRRTVDTMMALKASLLVLLSMSIACSAMLQIPKELPDMFPAGTLKGTQINAVLERIKGACPPFGNPDERFSVKVLGTTSPEIGGCVSMVPPNRHIVPSFNLWLGSLKFGGGGGCGEKNMDHYVFECMDKHPFFTEEDKLEGWYVMLFDRTARWTGHQDYRCALYKTVNEDPPTIQMMISANQSCKGLSERMKQSEHKVPEGFRHFTDGTVALHFTKDLQQTPVWRKKRSEVQSGGCRFPEWSQGSWTDLKVDGSLALYDSAFHEKDDVDYGQESDDGKDGDAETTSGEQYIQRSQRQKRCAWDVKTTTAPPRDKKFENAAKDGHTDGIEFTTKRDPTFPHIPYREKRSLDEDLNEKHKSTEHQNEIISQINVIFNWFHKMKALQKVSNHRSNEAKENTTDVNKITNDIHVMFDLFKKLKYMGKQPVHNDEGTNEHDNFKDDIEHTQDDDQLSKRNRNVPIENLLKKIYQKEPSSKSNILFSTTDPDQRSQRQKRCAWDVKTTTAPPRDKKFENAAKDGHTDGIEFTTKRDPTFPHIPYREKRSLDEDLNEKYKSTENDEEEALKKIKALDQFNRYMRWLNIVNAMVSIKYHRFEQSNKKIKENEYEIFPEDKPVPSPVKYLKFAEMAGIPYKQALINWRSMERAYRQKEAEVAFTAYPGQNHPDIVMKDFDQTFDGIEYDFDPLHPEGTADDPIAYRALTLPIGYQIKPQQSRRTTYEQKQSRDAPESATVVSHFQAVHSNSLNDRTHQENTPSLNQRMRRSSTQQNQQQSATTTFSWSCEMQVDDDEKHFQQPQRGAKFLTYGGRIVENNGLPGNDQHNENDSEKTYGCLWLVPRGPNILEFSIIGTGMPLKNQSMQNFARQLCSENSAIGKDSGVRNEKKLRPRRPWWITETRTDEKKRVPVGCPVPPGIEFYGVVPAPPPPSTVSANKAQPTPLRLCARLVSSADDCTTGQMGPTDQMKYTVSECVEQDSSSTGTAQTVVASQTIFEASRGHIVGGSWRRNKRHSAPTDTSTVASPVTSTSSNMPILPFSSHNTSTVVTDNITDHQTTGSTATFSIAINQSSTGVQQFIDITTIAPTNFTTSTATPFSTATSSTLPLFSLHETNSPEQQLPSPSKSSTTATTPTSTAAVLDTSSFHPVTDHHYRQQQQWQQSHLQPNNDDYYYRGRQQHYPPPPPDSTSTDNNYYYLHQQHWPQQQTQSYWLPQQHPITAKDYSNGYQHQTIDSGGHRTGDYYYHQQQQNYHNHQHNNNRHQQMPQPPRNSSLMLQHPTSGSWNIRGDRPLYISSGGGGDNNRDALAPWNSSSSISSSNGGWTTAAQQHWWYQQQQQRWQEEQQQQQQQLQQQKRQQQNNRGLSGILSLPPVPLPPLHAEQGAVTVSMPTPLPLHPRRSQKPSNHYYLPTLTTKTSSQPYQLRPKSESRYYQEREYQCLGQWTEPQQQISPVAGEKSVMLTYTYLKRLNPITKEGAQYECFVGTPIPNDEGLNPETTTTILLTEAGTNTKCSRLSDPYRSGMKLVGTKIKKQGACKGYAQPAQDTASGSWYSLKPQPISPSIPGTENGGGAWYAAPPIPVVAQGPTTMMPILTGRHTGGNGATFTSRQNEQTRRTQSANPPPKTNNSIRIVVDKRIFILLAVILFAGPLHNVAPRFFN